MKFLTSALMVICLLGLIFCDRNSNILVSNTPYVLNETALKKLISIEMVNYDSLVVKSSDSNHIANNAIISIELGEKDTGGFEPIQAAVPDYYEDDENYTLDFLIPYKISNLQLRAAYFTVRFILDDNSFFDIDTFALTYKFPYKSAEIFLKTNDITRVNLQDFIILGDKLYFYNLGPTLLREYDMSSSELREILHFGSGDHIAGQSNFLFLDTYHSSIHRYNITEDTLDVHFDLSSITNPNIRGLTVSNNSVYAMFPHSLESESILAQYDFDGSLISTEPLPFRSYYLAIHENIMYSVDYKNSQILRYNLISKLLLPAKAFPAESIEGICIHDNHLYFIDYYKRLISKIDLDSFNSLETLHLIRQQIPKNSRDLKSPARDREQEVNK